ncbi:lipoprotein [Caballeronia novacaledonica]|uniref:Lipoprotein n=2 Tax=Caballeronia novacaledonica TaxID=1544861 RepID=A0A2U3I8L7_9BURK|nr:lipoprotein [Caballeronia novacaledonica]
MNTRALLPMLALCVLLHACGGGGSSDNSATPATASAAAPASAPLSSSASPTVAQSTTPNVQTIRVASTPTNTRNMLLTSVTICVPGTSTCQTIDNVQVDTGSHGLRVLASALSPSIALPLVAGGNQNAIVAECAVFGSGYTWGAVRTADVRLAGQVAPSTSIQLIADNAAAATAQDCTQSGLPMLTASSLRANGILGVGPFAADCGAGCASSAMPRWYYSCVSGNCAASTLAVAQQVTNPVANFATDNNGVLIELPDVPDNGAATVTGTMTFGIGSQSNNLLGSATVLTSSSTSGYVTTDFGGGQYGSSFIDSGSNGVFFPSTTLARCGVWYCPSTPQTIAATIRSSSGAQSPVSFTIAQSTTLFGTGNFAFDNLAGSASGYFDWGLPFFYGRRVFTALAGRATPAGPGPYYAF